MSQYHLWDTPLLFLAVLMSLLGIGVEASIALDWYAQPQLSPVAWAMGGASLVFVIGHAIGTSVFEMEHLRLLLLAAGVFFIGPFLIFVGVVIAILAIWAIAVLVGELF